MNKRYAERIVSEWESRLDELVLSGDSLVLPNCDIPALGSVVYADGQEDQWTTNRHTKALSQAEYEDAKRLLQAIRRSKPEGGKPGPKGANKVEFFGALGYVVAKTPEGDLESDEKDKSDRIADQVIDEYERRDKGPTHTHMHRWVKRFLQEYRENL